jgi:hypothetical protein
MTTRKYNIAEKQVFKILMLVSGMVEDYPCRKFSSKNELINLISNELMLSIDKVKKILSEFIYFHNFVRLKNKEGEIYVEILREDPLPDEQSEWKDENGDYKYYKNKIYFHNLTNSMRATFKIKDELYHFGIEELEVIECLISAKYGITKYILPVKENDNPFEKAEKTASKFQHYESVEYIASKTGLTIYKVRNILHKFEEISQRIPQLKKYFRYRDKTRNDETIRKHKGTRTKTIFSPNSRKELNKALNILLEHFHIKVERRIGSIHKSKKLIYDRKGYNGECAKNNIENKLKFIKDPCYRAYYRVKAQLYKIDSDCIGDEIISRKIVRIIDEFYRNDMLDELIEIEEILLYNHVLLNVLEKVQSIQRKYKATNKTRILM